MRVRPMRVLIVEDEALVALMIEEILVDAGFVVCGLADTAARALALALAHGPTVALVDVRLAGGEDGIALAETLAAEHPITQGISDFELTTEQYWVLHDDYNDVLATTTQAVREWDP